MNRPHRWCCRSSGWQQKLNGEILPWTLEWMELGDHVLEIGPGPALTTDWLRQRSAGLTCLELDRDLASFLEKRIGRDGIRVDCGDLHLVKQMLLFSRRISDVRVDTIDEQIEAEASQKHQA